MAVKKIFLPMDETHVEGHISIENAEICTTGYGDLGIQIAKDGRVWVCIDGIAFLRFKPNFQSDQKERKRR